MKHRWTTVVDNVMDRIPLARSIYNVLKKLMQMLEHKDESELKSVKSVMCHFGGKGARCTGIDAEPGAHSSWRQGLHGVLIPTAPILSGGAILFVPVDWVELLDVPFDGLFNIYMFMGATSMDYLRPESMTPVGDSGRKSSLES